MKTKLPPEAFSVYLGLGQARSYEAVARHFGVDKRTVTARASKENWQQKLEAAETKLRERAEERAVESLEEMNERHMKMIQLVQKKALEGLRDTQITSGMDAARVLLLSVEKERLVRGEPTERAVLDTVALIRSEYQSLMLAPGELEDWDEPAKPKSQGHEAESNSSPAQETRAV